MRIIIHPFKCVERWLYLLTCCVRLGIQVKLRLSLLSWYHLLYWIVEKCKLNIIVVFVLDAYTDFFCVDYNPPMDLGILVDSSSAVDWGQMQSLLKGYVGTRNISFDGDHVGIVDFASTSKVALAFPTSRSIDYNKNVIWQAIDDLKPQGGDDRRVDLGLETVSSDLFGPQSGARRDADQVQML